MSSPPSLLLVDAGNTRLKWATAHGHAPIRYAGKVATKAVTSTWITSLARKFPRHKLVLASVVPRLTSAFRRPFAGRLEIVTGKSSTLGLTFDYPNAAEIGADRLAAAVVAHAENHWPAIIVSCGTATVFTVLDVKGRLCGGAIAPGLQTQLAALLGATAQLPITKLGIPRRALARSTKEAIRAGVMFNFQGGAREILQRISEALPGRRAPHIFLTGGNAKYLAGTTGFPDKVRPLLVHEGLRMIGLRAFPEML
jgi:type III pantothenate kinase